MKIVLCKLHNTPVGIEIYSKALVAANMESPRVLVLYQEEVGQRRSLAESRPISREIPGGVARGSIPGRIAASTQSGVPSVPGKIPGGMTSCPTPVGQQAGVVLFEILRLYQGSSMFCLYQVKSRFCLYQVKSRFCLYQVKSTFCLYQGVVYLYSHQRLWGGECLGRPIYMPVERLRRRLRDCLREECLWGDDAC